MVNAFFNANDYLAKNKDLVAAGLHTEEQLWEHYVTYGAQENAEGNADRAPNSWFDVNYYLGNYPDLVNAGITASQALNHYFEYGINEGRSFNPTLLPSQFNAEQYAADNKDVREAFGIEEDAELTAQDEANLLKHYLSYGYAEGREGAGKEFEDEVNALNDVKIVFGTEQSQEILGTIGNDLFVVEKALNAKTVIDGLGGTDTVEFVDVDNVKTAAAADAVTLRNIEKVVVDNVNVDANVISKLDSVKLEGEANATLNFTAAAVAAADDVLNVDVATTTTTTTTTTTPTTTTTSLTVNGFETVNLAFDAKAEGLSLFANDSQGTTQTINLSGGDKATSVGLTFNNKGSAKLTDLTIDGSALGTSLGGIALEKDEAQNIKNVTIKGSANAENDFSITVGADQLLTVIGGNEDDTFTAVAAIETLTGGKGNDTFGFTDVTSKVTTKKVDSKTVIDGVDTITDFKKGDALDLVGVTTLTKLTLKTGEDAALKTLEDWVVKAATAGKAFNFEGDGYVLVADAAAEALDGVSLIKLAGVNVDSFFKAGESSAAPSADGFSFA